MRYLTLTLLPHSGDRPGACLLAVIAEELGFAAVFVVIALFIWLLFRAYAIGRQAARLELDWPRQCQVGKVAESRSTDQLVADFELRCARPLPGQTLRVFGLVELELSLLVYVELEGVEPVAQFCARALDPLDASQHRIGSVEVKLERGRATSVSYLCAEHLKDGRRFTVGGRYVDQWSRTPAGWRIAQRELEILWTDGDPRVLAGPERP